VAAVTERSGAIYRFEDASSSVTGRRQPDGSCVTEQRPSGMRKRLLVGVPYPAGAWAPLRVVPADGARLSADVATLVSGESVEAVRRADRSAMFRDRGLGACGPVWIDGALRCVPPRAPNASWWETAYSDNRCTSPAVLFWSDEAPPALLTVHEGIAPSTDGNLPTGHVFERGSELPRAYVRTAEGCSEKDLQGQHAYSLAMEVPGSQFAELRLSTE